MTVKAMKCQAERKWTERDHETWGLLFKNLDHCRKHQAVEMFNSGLDKLHITGDRIPDLNEVNAIMEKSSGWRGVMVEGYEDALSFFPALARREYPIGNFIRDPKDLGYTPAPDVFHDLYGHLPFLVDKTYGDFCQKIGVVASKYLDQPEKLIQFDRLFWFGVEFPLIKTTKGVRIFGGGILSSNAESDYALGVDPEILPFDIEVIRRQDFKIDEFQKRIFILDHPEQLYGCLPAYEKGL